MSLINYIEPVSVGSIFVGLGAMVVSFVLAWIMLRLFKPLCDWIQGIYNHDLRYWIVEDKMLEKIAREKGIDIEAELIKRSVISKKRKTFRRKIEEEVFNKMFPKEKKGE